MARGRRPNLISPVTWKCSIPEDVAAKVDLLLLDPVRGVPEYGKRSELVTQLLRAWLETKVKSPLSTQE